MEEPLTQHTIAARFRGYLPMVVDVETGGFDPIRHALLEIAAVVIEMDAEGFVRRGATHTTHVVPFPGALLDPKSLEITGIIVDHPLRLAVEARAALDHVFAPVRAAAKAAGCVMKNFPDEGAVHVAKKLTVADFKTNPPTSGDHNINPAQDGVYAPGNEPEIENWVHTLEHGRILLQYKPDTAPGRISQLQTLFNEPVLDSGNGYHSVLMQNNTKMPFEVAAVAWRHYVGCPEFTDQSLAAMREFRRVYVDKAPEQIP